MMLTVALDVSRYHLQLWDEYQRFMDHPFQCDEIRMHCFGTYFSSIIYVTAEWPFYDAINKIGMIDEDAIELWNDESFWSVMNTDNNPRVLSAIDEIRILGGNFLCTLINDQITISIVDSLRPSKTVLVNPESLKQIDWRRHPDQEILTFQFTVN